MVKHTKKNNTPTTAVCKNDDCRFNLKLVLYLQSQCKTESLGFLNPPLLQAAKRYLQAEKRATAQSSTFHFARASQNKKSLPFPTANRKKND
jgi:hypothetical protein